MVVTQVLRCLEQRQGAVVGMHPLHPGLNEGAQRFWRPAQGLVRMKEGAEYDEVRIACMGPFNRVSESFDDDGYQRLRIVFGNSK